MLHSVPMLPKAFRGLRVLRFANSFAVASALAALTGLSLESIIGGGDVFRGSAHRPGWALLSLPTFVIGLVWATLFRLPRSSDRTRAHPGWLACIPLAMLNAALSSALLFTSDPGPSYARRILMGAIAGATFGAIIWIPALLATIALFGVPLWRAQKLAQRGLAGEERGERTVGAVCALLGAFGAIGALMAIGSHQIPFALGMAAVGLGSVAAALAHAREKRRRAFVAEAESGRVAGYRVDVVPEGKVLVRVIDTVATYRHAEQYEALVALDADGGVRQATAERR